MLVLACVPIGNQDQAARERIRQGLVRLAQGAGDPKAFSLTYHDLHPLFGGLHLEIHGDGKVEQRAIRERVGKPRLVPQAELRKLAALLVRLKAWEQRIPDAPLVPDESRARLTIRLGKDEATIWERFNDLAKNNRLLQIREAMKRAAWMSEP